MQVVASLFTNGSELDWARGELRTVCDSNIHLIESVGTGRAIFCSDHFDLLDMAAGLDVEPRAVTPPPSGDDHVELLAIMAHEAGKDAPAVFLDLRNPLFDTVTIEQAMTQYGQNEKVPLVSVSQPEDHPFYLRTASSSSLGGMLHLLTEQEKADTDKLLTRPFFFDWQCRAAEQMPASGKAIQTQLSDVHLIQDSEEAAQAILPARWADVKRGSVLGCAMAQEREAEPGIALFRDVQGSCFLQLAEYETCRIEFVAFGRAGLFPEERCSVDFEQGTACLPERMEKHLNEDLVSGWVLFIESCVMSGEINHVVPFIPSEPCWSGQTNQITGERISGRQQLPEVWAPDLTLAICRPDEALQLEKLFAAGDLRPFVMDKASVLLRSQHDLIRWKSFQEAAGECP